MITLQIKESIKNPKSKNSLTPNLRYKTEFDAIILENLRSISSFFNNAKHRKKKSHQLIFIFALGTA